MRPQRKGKQVILVAMVVPDASTMASAQYRLMPALEELRKQRPNVLSEWWIAEDANVRLDGSDKQEAHFRSECARAAKETAE